MGKSHRIKHARRGLNQSSNEASASESASAATHTESEPRLNESTDGRVNGASLADNGSQNAPVMRSTSYDGERDDVGSRKQVAEYTSQE